MSTLLAIDKLCVEYWGIDGSVRAVEGVSLDIRRGEIFGLAGESGSVNPQSVKPSCGFCTPRGHYDGQVLYDGIDILDLDDDALRELRWRKIAMVFQSALNALNLVMTIGRQLMDTLEAHGHVTDARERTAAPRTCRY